MSNLQQLLDGATDGQPLRLNPPGGEFQGPVVIRAPVVLDGQGATIWAERGPVVSILAGGVVLNRVNIEITANDAAGDGEAGCALQVAPGLPVTLNQVAVRGSVRGLDAEEGDWDYPRSIRLGALKARRGHRFTVRLVVPVPCALVSQIDGLQVQPARLHGGGVEEVVLTLDPLSPGTLVRGEIWLQTGLLTRRIKVAGTVPKVEGSAVVFGDGQVVWEPQSAPPEPGPVSGDDRVTDVPPEPAAHPPVEAAQAHPGGAPAAAPPAVSPPLPEEIGKTPSTQKTSNSSSVPVAPPPEVVVSKLGEAHFTTIGEAIRASKSGTRIRVRPGVYRESLVLDKKLEILAEGSAGEVVVESTGGSCLRMQAEFARVRGLTFRALSAPGRKDRYAVDVPLGQLELEDCDITSDRLACVAVHGSKAAPVLRRCRLHGSGSAGLLVYDQGKGEFEECVLFDNAQAGVEIRQANPILRRCQVHGNGEVGVLIHQNAQGRLEDCEVFDNALAGVEVRAGANPLLKHCRVRQGRGSGALVHDFGRGRFEDCEVSANALAGVEVRQGGDPVLKRCAVHGGQQAGLLFGKDARGTAEECDVRDNALAGVEVRQGADPVLRGCKVHGGKEAGVLVCRGGKGTLEGCEVYGNAGPGLAVTGGCPKVKACSVREHRLAGVVFVGKDAVGVLEGCTIRKNGLAGSVVARQGGPILRLCAIHDNGVGVWVCEQGGGVIEQCDLTGNARGGLDVGRDCTVSLHQNTTDAP